MELIKNYIKEIISTISAFTTILIALLPNDFPYHYRVIIILALCVIFVLEILFWKVLKAHRVVIIFSVLLSIAAVLLYRFHPVALTPKLCVPKDCDEITMNGEMITTSTINSLNSLRSLRSISFENCIFEDGAILFLDLPQSVTNVSLFNCEGITDFWWLAHLKNLENLTLHNCGLTDANFPNLQTHSLHSIHVDNNKGFSELKWLPISDLENISFCETSVSSLEKLAQYKSLKTIYGNNSLVFDLSSLVKLTELRSISFNNCSIETVTDDFMSLRLESLSVSGNKLYDCSGFQNFTQLVDVDLSYNRLTDISWLAKSKDTLESVYLSWNPLDSENLLFLSTFSHLVKLGISGIKLNSLDFIMNMKDLKTLDAVQCDINDISVMDKLQLKDIRLGLNGISDISPLVALLENDKAAAPAFAASYVPKFNFLDLSGNIADGLNLEKLAGNTIILSYYPGLSQIRINFSKIYVVDCPADKRVVIEDLNAGEVFFITQKEALSVS